MAFWETIDAQMRNTGFRPVNNKPNWYWRAENPVLYLVCLLDGNPEATAVYEKIYAEYKRLYDYFGRGENNVMKTLRKIREEA